MYCRCPDCHATYPIIAAQLAAVGGRVRCERCHKAFNALDSLFDQWPEPGESPASGSKPAGDSPSSLPLLGHSRIRRDSATPGDSSISAPLPAAEQRPAGALSWLGWGFAAAALVALLLIQTFHDPEARAWLGLAPVPAPTVQQTSVSLSPVQLYSRDLHEHPGVEDGLVLSAVLRNPDSQPRPYPLLEVSLTNAGNEIIAQRRFAPEEYLDRPEAGSGRFPADALLPLLLEFTDPGPEATGYQLEFFDPPAD